MTGNGLVKFERFVALNKLPWDDVNDQFVIQVSQVKCRRYLGDCKYHLTHLLTKHFIFI